MIGLVKLAPWLAGGAIIAVVAAYLAGFHKGKELEQLRCEAAAARAKAKIEEIDRKVRREIEVAAEQTEAELRQDLEQSEKANEKLRQELKDQGDKCLVVPDDVDRL